MDTLSERLQYILKLKDISQGELARQSGLTTAYISQLVTGKRTNMTAKTATAMGAAIRINPDWILTGKGEIEIPEDRTTEIARITGTLLRTSPESFQARVITVLSQLSSEEWDVLEGIAVKLAQKKNQE